MKNKKAQALLQLALVAGILVILNVLANYFNGYVDLTEEKRYTLTEPTQDLLKSLDEVVYVQVLLEGEFPAGFKRLQQSTRELLEDFRSVSSLIEYEFDDPLGGTEEQNQARQSELQKDGLIPTNLRVKDTDGESAKRIYPYAIFTYKGRQYPVNLLENDRVGVSPEVVLNNSVALLEYKFANAIQKLQLSNKPNVVFLQGHGELAPPEVYDLERNLRQYYDTGHLPLDSLVTLPVDRVSVLIVAKPRYNFSDADKFKIDQYVMNGGKVMWLIDRLNVSIDSVNINGTYIPNNYQLNLEDMLFKYGIRVDPNMVLDLESTTIPLNVGQIGTQTQFDQFPFFYYPIAAPTSTHPIVKSLDRVFFKFPSSIDTSVRTKTNVEKTVLLASSQRSRIQFAPTTLDFDFLRQPPNPDNYNQPNQAMAVLYEGIFLSYFENRVAEGFMQTLQQLNIPFRAESVPTNMIVVSDGDIARNLVRPNPDAPNGFEAAPLGLNPYDRYTYANKDFLLNCIEYLLDENGVIAARGKEVKLRLLDTVKAESEKTKWQILNIVLPLVFLAMFGVIFNWLRRRKYGEVKDNV
ncbi:MAG: gliding motility-associated ABC transporter substrate-binding protein GldG [Bacteroidota bacterium]